MRILFVALPSNIHTLRWINHITDQGWEIHLAPSYPDQLHPDLVGKVTFHDTKRPLVAAPANRVVLYREKAIALLKRWPHPRGSGHVRRLIEWLRPGAIGPSAPVNTGTALAAVIREIRPDIIHSHIIQPSGYETLEAHQGFQGRFPKWIVSNWGSDIYFFGQVAAHREKIEAVLAACDYLSCECERDVALARQYGFTGKALPVLSAAGGLDLARWQALRQSGPTSERRVILMKGYQHTVGRALVGLRALELCADLLQGYRIVIPMASPDVVVVAEVVAKRIGVPIETIPYAWHADYEDLVRRYGVARIHIGLSISDGISQALLEAMMMGAFPIQSCTACADEWFVDGEGGLLVPPEDPHIIADAIRRALTDDALVNRAAEINAETVRQRLAYADVKEKIIAMYKSVYEDTLARD